MTGASDRLKAIIVREIAVLLEEGDKPVPELDETAVLLDTGLDSLDFAVLVSRLEDELDYDPFTEMDDPVYPQTLGELVAVYAEHAPVLD